MSSAPTPQLQAIRHVDASDEALYDLVADITRTGEWSPENQGGEWRRQRSSRPPRRATRTRDMDDVAAVDATDQAALVRAGQVTARELVQAAIGRIERLNPILNAVVTPTFDRALEAAAGDLPQG